jgi:ATPase subunit of ABC transporter with duplicated ATPase domains
LKRKREREGESIIMTTTTTTSSSGSAQQQPPPRSDVVKAQLQSLDDTDLYATKWKEAKERYYHQASTQHSFLTAGSQQPLPLKKATFKWGGRGQGGRGTARRTFQIRDVVVKDTVRLEYVGSSSASALVSSSPDVPPPSSGRLLLEGATLKLLSGHVYSLVGRNGTGKSTLLKRLQAGNVPGVPPWIRTLYVGQDEEESGMTDVSDPFVEAKDQMSDGNDVLVTPISFLERRLQSYKLDTSGSIQQSIDELEHQMEQLDVEQEAEKFEQLSEQLSALDDQLQQEDNDDGKETSDSEAKVDHVDSRVVEALDFMGVPEELRKWPVRALSPGIRQKVCLASALICPCDLLLLDEPSKELDVPGLHQLRTLVHQVSQQRSTTVLLVSHDLDLVNDVATDVVLLSHQQLQYVPGNYDDYLAYKRQVEIRDLRQVLATEKKSEHMHQTLENLKQQVTSGKGGDKKKQSKQVAAQKKKMEQRGIVASGGEATKAIKIGPGAPTATLAMEASARRGLSPSQLLELMEQRKRPPPDRSVQFVFRDPKSTWDEPLILATEVGHRYPNSDGELLRRPNKGEPQARLTPEDASSDMYVPPPPKPGYVLDSVDLCIEEGRTYCIVGESMSGKSTLLRLLAKHDLHPTEGTIQHAAGLDVGLLDAKTMDRMMAEAKAGSSITSANAISYLTQLYPTKPEKEIRGELTNFGLSPQQAATNLRFLSGGERRRLCLTAIMLNDPQVLVMDQPTSDLDAESVEALIYGLKRWKGTLVMASHDASFVRELEAQCHALVDHRLYRVEGGIDAYLNAFGAV